MLRAIKDLLANGGHLTPPPPEPPAIPKAIVITPAGERGPLHHWDWEDLASENLVGTEIYILVITVGSWVI